MQVGLHNVEFNVFTLDLMKIQVFSDMTSYKLALPCKYEPVHVRDLSSYRPTTMYTASYSGG